MHAPTLFYTSALIASAIAGPVASRRDEDNETQKRICPNLNVAERGCIRCKSYFFPKRSGDDVYILCNSQGQYASPICITDTEYL